MSIMTDELTHDKLTDLLAYDPDTGIFTWKSRANKRLFVGSRAGYVGSQGYRYIKILGKKYPEHRLAWFYVHGQLNPKRHIDHINHDRSDNRMANLRLVTAAQNAQNRSKTTHSRTQQTGIYYRKRDKKYVAQLRVGGRKVFQKAFDDADEAAQAYKEQALRYGFHANHGT